MSGTAPALELEAVTRRFPARERLAPPFTAIERLSFRVAPGTEPVESEVPPETRASAPVVPGVAFVAPVDRAGEASELD